MLGGGCDSFWSIGGYRAGVLLAPSARCGGPVEELVAQVLQEA
jgi:hypothetical protein